MTDQDLAQIIESCAMTNSYFDEKKAVLTPKWLWVSLPEIFNFVSLEDRISIPKILKNSELLITASNYDRLNYRVYTTRNLYKKHAGFLAKLKSVLCNRIIA